MQFLAIFAILPNAMSKERGKLHLFRRRGNSPTSGERVGDILDAIRINHIASREKNPLAGLLAEASILVRELSRDLPKSTKLQNLTNISAEIGRIQERQGFIEALRGRLPSETIEEILGDIDSKRSPQ